MINWEKLDHGTLNIGYKQCAELFDTGEYKLKDTDQNEVEFKIKTPGVTTFRHTPIGLTVGRYCAKAGTVYSGKTEKIKHKHKIVKDSYT